MDLATEKSIQYAERIAYSSKEVLCFTYDQAVKHKDSPGVFVECGVAAGAQIIAMAAGAPNKTIYAFDSFEGIPLPSNKDDQMPGIRFLTKDEQKSLPNPGDQLMVSSGATVVSLEDFWHHVRSAFDYQPMENVIAVHGWFENTVEHFDKPIALLRLDGDLYNSTYVCLKYLYPKVIKGGCVIIDDWALPGCQQAVIDYGIEVGLNKFWHHEMQFITDENSTVAYWTK